MTTETTRTEMPVGSKTFNDHAEELLAHFKGVDRAKLLKTTVALALMDVKYGNKREERAACDLLNLVYDLLNLVQAEAVKQLKASAESANAELSDSRPL